MTERDRRRLLAGVALGSATGFAVLGGVLLMLSRENELPDEGAAADASAALVMRSSDRAAHPGRDGDDGHDVVPAGAEAAPAAEKGAGVELGGADPLD